MATDSKSTRPLVRRPLQYNLRTLFWLTAGCSAIFALMAMMGAVWSLLLLFLLALVVAHVFGNAIGTRLRNDDARRAEQTLPSGIVPLATIGLPKDSPQIALRERQPLGQLLLVFVVAGGVGGAILGHLALVYGQWLPLRPAESVVGIASCALLGSIAGFLASSFFKIAVWPAVKFFFGKK